MAFVGGEIDDAPPDRCCKHILLATQFVDLIDARGSSGGDVLSIEEPEPIGDPTSMGCPPMSLVPEPLAQDTLLDTISVPDPLP